MINFEKEISQFMGPKRYAHSISVQKECVNLAKLFKLGEKDVEELSVAGYLHDITKERTLEEHLVLCEKFGIKYDENDKYSPKIFHARTGACLAKELYPEYVNDNVFEYIWNHTTGCENMSLGAKIVYLADYIEPTRHHKDCVLLREMFYNKPNDENLMEHLENILIVSFNMTIKDLLKDGKPIDKNTVSARNSLIRRKMEENFNG